MVVTAFLLLALLVDSQEGSSGFRVTGCDRLSSAGMKEAVVEIVARSRGLEVELWARFQEGVAVSFEDLSILAVLPGKTVFETIGRLAGDTGFKGDMLASPAGRQQFVMELSRETFFGGSLGSFLTLAICLTLVAQEVGDGDWGHLVDDWFSRVEDRSSCLSDEERELAGIVLDQCRRVLPC